jgi:hypothetical protein
MKVRYVYDLQYYLLGFSCKNSIFSDQDPDPDGSALVCSGFRIRDHIEVKIWTMIPIRTETHTDPQHWGRLAIYRFF